MDQAHCPDCDGKIVLNLNVKIGQKLTCPHCDADLEVISIDPMELDWAYDWDDEDEEDVYEDEEEEYSEDDDY